MSRKSALPGAGAQKKLPRTIHRREWILLDGALDKCGVTRKWKRVGFDNPNATDRHGTVVGGTQWVDYIIAYRGRLFAIEFFPRWHGNARPHRYQKNWMEEKRLYLENRGIPCLIVPRTVTSQEYWLLVYRFLHRNGG